MSTVCLLENSSHAKIFISRDMNAWSRKEIKNAIGARKIAPFNICFAISFIPS
jgi:hypothetical protein